MKLYTEETVKFIAKAIYEHDFDPNKTPQELVDELKPIELPSVEFINNYIEDNFYNSERIHNYTEKQQLLMKTTTKAGALWLNGWIKEQINKTK